MKDRHADPIEMVAYARGDMEPAAGDRLLRHCESCEDCGNQLAAVVLLRRPGGVRAWYRRPSVAAAAAVVSLVALGVVGFHLRGSSVASDTASPRLATPDASAVANRGTADLAVRHVPEAWLGVFLLPLEGAPAVRTNAGGESIQPTLEEAVVALSAGRAAHAVELLEGCCGGDRFDAWGTLLLGVSRLVEGTDLAGASRALQRVLEHEPADQGGAATWFLANARLAQGRPGDALRLLRGLEPHMPFAAEAADLIPRIERRLGADSPAQ